MKQTREGTETTNPRMMNSLSGPAGATTAITPMKISGAVAGRADGPGGGIGTQDGTTTEGETTQRGAGAHGTSFPSSQ